MFLDLLGIRMDLGRVWKRVAVEYAKTRERVRVSNVQELKNMNFHVHKIRQRRDVRVNITTFPRVAENHLSQRRDVTESYSF